MERDWMSCPICASKTFNLIGTADRYDMGIPTRQCEGCGLVMTNPVPSEDALSRFYREHYRRYYRKVESPSESHIEEYGLAERARDTAAFFKAAGLLDGNPHILDVGCAEGSLLRAISQVAPHSTRVGIEPNPRFGEFARSWAGATVYSDLAEVEQASARFNLIIINHVLEHIREPVLLLQRLIKLGAPNVRIYVDVPDAARYRSIDDIHIAHLYHFTVASLQNIAARAGLHTIRVEKHDPTKHPLSVRAVF
jgi:SAM-dependent methyltransferase